MRDRQTASAAPRLQAGKNDAPAGRVPFGITRTESQRIELVFALRQGGTLGITHDIGQAVTADTLDRYCEELRQAVSAGKDWWQFADSWNGTGQRAYLALDQVVGFTVRPAR